MPEVLTEDQIASLHRALLALRAELADTTRVTDEAAGTVVLDQVAVGRVSRVDAMQQQAMAQEQQRRTELRRKQVEVALRAIADEEYGDCRQCGEPIGIDRLTARPETVVCVPCMRQLEIEHG
ncbi:MAG: TraR/DksA C4-type zinc finger protein [Myxococcales bacterium]|nr:TraR/DksA C4-type zinc finger protein [Myxococcales bacterium]MCA9566595.1 TraR/DksA C4-type zinc finger protein [Myxococcales bacterium]